jgi:hypothetical protein
MMTDNIYRENILIITKTYLDICIYLHVFSDHDYEKVSLNSFCTYGCVLC